MKYGYTRVSKFEQNLDLQLDAINSVGVNKVFSEKVSGAKEDRKILGKLLETLKEGDTLVIWKLDRLGRSTKELVGFGVDFRKRKINLISHTEKIDTSTPMGRLFFHFMAALAEFERDLTIERTLAGLKAARARGKSSGRPAGLSEGAYTKALAAYQLYQNKNMTVKDIIKQLHISKPTLYTYIRHIENEKKKGAEATADKKRSVKPAK